MEQDCAAHRRGGLWLSLILKKKSSKDEEIEWFETKSVLREPFHIISSDGVSEQSVVDRMKNNLLKVKGLFLALADISTTVNKQELETLDFWDSPSRMRFHAGFCHDHERIVCVAASCSRPKHVLEVARGLSKLRGLLETKEEWSLECDVRCSKLLDDAIAGEFSSKKLDVLMSQFVMSSVSQESLRKRDVSFFPGASVDATIHGSCISFLPLDVSIKLHCRLDNILSAFESRRMRFASLSSRPPARYSLPLGMCLLFPGCEQLSPGGIIASHLPAATMDELAIVVRALGLWRWSKKPSARESHPHRRSLHDLDWPPAEHSVVRLPGKDRGNRACRMLAVLAWEGFILCSLLDSPCRSCEEEGVAELCVLSELMSRLKDENLLTCILSQLEVMHMHMKDDDFEDFDSALPNLLRSPPSDQQLVETLEASESVAASVPFLSSSRDSRAFVFDSPLDLNDPSIDRGGSYPSEAPQSPSSPQSPWPPPRIARMSEVKIPRRLRAVRS